MAEIRIEITGDLDENCKKGMLDFFEYYDIDDLLKDSDAKPKLKPKSERICRFCNKKQPEVTFKKEAHILPQLMGNKNLICDFECDSCNSLFSKYENEFANYLGISRTLISSKGQEGIPKFKNPDKKLIVENQGTLDGFTKLKVSIGDSNLRLSQDKKHLQIEATKHPYSPLSIYKLFLKIGYSLLSEQELLEYPGLRKIFMSDANDAKLENNPLFKIFMMTDVGTIYHSPLIFYCKKKADKSNSNYPSRVFVIHFQNYIYQFFMPYSVSDKWMYEKGVSIQQLVLPPFLSKKQVEEGGIKKSIQTFSTSIKTKNEKQKMIVEVKSMEKIKPEEKE